MASKVKVKAGQGRGGKAKKSASEIYLYGVTQSPGHPLARTTPGVDGIASVEMLPCGEFYCWISRVDRKEFSQQLQHNMENLEWLASASVAHHRVVGQIAEGGEILPARFGTVFADEKSLLRDVERRRSALLAAFKRLAGTEEWGVKIFAHAPAPSEATKARSGKEYLQKKSAALEASSIRKADPELDTFAAALSRIAVDEVRGGKFSGAQRHLEFQASYLIRRKQREKFHALLRQYAGKWGNLHRIEYAGPWPPYSFVSSDGG